MPKKKLKSGARPNLGKELRDYGGNHILTLIALGFYSE